ncbi:MAG: amino acid permease [Candidatus Bathyarchaeia archaeon]
MSKVTLSRQLNAFDVTNLVVGSVIGADVYVAAALGARLLGPASILVWLLAGLIAIVIALSFSRCAAILPKVGGPYAYSRDVAGPFKGFLVGWALLLAEWFSLAVFPVAFTQYFLSFIPGLSPMAQILLKGIFIGIIFLTNVVGVRMAGKFNDLLTIGKLGPLLLLTGAGLVFIVFQPQVALARFHPFLIGQPTHLGQALVLIFWAYAGFELSTLPADEIQDAPRTIPRAIAMGMLIVMVFYLTTNFVIIANVDQSALASSPAPLTVAAENIFGLLPGLGIWGSLMVAAGALISITGADESGTLGTSRLAFAMSIDGLLPRVFSRLHSSFRTPYIGLAILCSTAFLASVIGTLSDLINSSVFLLSFTYFATGISAILLERKYRAALRPRDVVVPALTIAFSALLMTQVTLQQIAIALMLLGLGVPLYTFFSPKSELTELKAKFLSTEAILNRAYRQRDTFLAHLVHHLIMLIYRRKHVQRAWLVEKEHESQ